MKILLFILVLFQLNVLSASIVHENSLESFYLFTRKTSVEMIKNNIKGARDDFYSEKGYKTGFPIELKSAFKSISYSNSMYCNDVKEMSDVAWIFKEMGTYLEIEITSDKITTKEKVELSEIKIGSKNRFFIDSNRFKMKGFYKNFRENIFVLSEVRLIFNNGKVCAVSLIGHK